MDSKQKISSKSAFNWNIYRNRKTALQHLKRNCTLVDTILESEDGLAYEFVHSQVISALGDKLNNFINQNGTYVQSYRAKTFETIDKNNSDGQQQSSAETSASSKSQPKDAIQIDISSPPSIPVADDLSITSPTSTSTSTKTVTSPPTSSSSPSLSTSTSISNAVNAATIPVVRQSYWSRWPGRVKLIRLPKVTKYTLEILVECAYTGYIRTDLPSGGIWQVLKVANHYEMFEVIRACCNFLIRWLDRSNCVLFYHIGMKHRHQLQRSAWHKIRANFKYILSENLSHNNNNNDNNGAVSSQLNQMATKQTIQYNYNNQQHHHHHHHRHHKGSSSTASASASVSASASTSSSSAATGGNANLFDDYNLLLHLAAWQQQLAYQGQKSSNKRQALSSQQQQQQQVEEGEINIGNNNTNNKRQDYYNIITSLATIKFEHFEPLLMHDKLNIENEETIWYAIKLWCNENLAERGAKLASLLSCMRFPRLRTGTDFSARVIWRDPLILSNKFAQHELAVLDRNHRDYLVSTLNNSKLRDGFSLPCALNPRQLRPRVPHSILLAIGGWQQGHPTRLIESYDLNCNLWFESRHKIMTPLAYHGIECMNGLLYICGGTDGAEILNELFTFDPIRGDCSQKRSMHESRCYVSTAHLGSTLYAIGGHNGSQRMKSAEKYDSNEDYWRTIEDMNVARSDASACVYESLIYIAGGLNDQIIENSVEFYNDGDNTWTFITSMETPRTSFTLLLFRENLLAIGGNNGSERLSSVESYDFKTKLWSHHSNMRFKRSTFSAALLDENKLIVVGGYNGQTPFSQVEMYDEHSSSWLTMHKIRYDRSGLKVIVVNDLANADEYTFLGSSLASSNGGVGGGGGVGLASGVSGSGPKALQ